jgi:hypothetical protein
MRFDLDDLSGNELDDLDAFIHFAWSWEESEVKNRETNVDNLNGLLTRAADRDCRLILISTESASPVAASVYGKNKYLLERVFLDLGGSAVRCGIILGKQSNVGILSSLAKIASIPGVCVRLSPDPEMFLTNLDDLASNLAGPLLVSPTSGVFRIVSKAPLPLSKILHAQRQRPAFLHVRVPVRVIIKIVDVLTALGLKLPFRRDSLSSLLTQKGLAEEVITWNPSLLAVPHF